MKENVSGCFFLNTVYIKLIHSFLVHVTLLSYRIRILTLSVSVRFSKLLNLAEMGSFILQTRVLLHKPKCSSTIWSIFESETVAPFFWQIL